MKNAITVVMTPALPLLAKREKFGVAVLPEMPHSIISIGGTTPKTGIEAGRPVSKLILPVTLYVNAGILPECKASNIAAEFKTLLENPVLLLL